jgi:bifunctional ADP-heptose synthase (sugar kinase/adenylyltransferase)
MYQDIQQQKQFKILLVGELCQDIYVFGEVDRISPEAPVPVLKEKSTLIKSGMSGNVLNNLKSILPDAEIILCQNPDGKIKKTRFIDSKSNYQILRLDSKDNILPLDINDIPDCKYDAVIISDYDKGLINKSVIKYITEKYANTSIFADTKKRDLDSFKNSIIKINEKESKEAKCKDLKSVIVTLGSAGCMYQGKVYPSSKVDVHDVCGAGDVFLASLVSRFLETNDIQRAIKTANNCAALSVTKLGCYTIKRGEYEDLCF